MDEERAWAEILATQALACVALGTVINTLARGDAERHDATVRQVLDAAQQALRQIVPSNAPPDLMLRAHAGAEARIDQIFAALAGPLG
jgi:hypothetical protein